MMKNFKFVTLLSTLSLLSTGSFAATDSPCEPIKSFYNKSRDAIAADLKNLNSLQILDAVDQANDCKNQSDTYFVANPVDLGGGKNANVAILKKSAQSIIDAALYLDSETSKVEQSNKSIEDNLKGFNFAAGVGSISLKTPDIRAAVVDQGVIRVTDEEKLKLGLWLSTNTYFFQTTTNRSRVGLFLATQLGGGGSSDLLNAFAIGLSFTSNHISNAKPGNAPLVYQIGYGITRVQTFADGFSNGMTLPSGTSQPLFKKTTREGLVALVSYSFE